MDTLYYDQWSAAEAEETDNTSPAPFGDNTFRVIDEAEGGVIAYFGTQERAEQFIQVLRLA